MFRAGDVRQEDDPDPGGQKTEPITTICFSTTQHHLGWIIVIATRVQRISLHCNTGDRTHTCRV